VCTAGYCFKCTLQSRRWLRRRRRCLLRRRTRRFRLYTLCRRWLHLGLSTRRRQKGRWTGLLCALFGCGRCTRRAGHGRRRSVNAAEEGIQNTPRVIVNLLRNGSASAFEYLKRLVSSAHKRLELNGVAAAVRVKLACLLAVGALDLFYSLVVVSYRLIVQTKLPQSLTAELSCCISSIAVLLRGVHDILPGLAIHRPH